MHMVALRRAIARTLIAGAALAAGASDAQALPDGSRLSEQGSFAQYIEYFGAALPISYGDAVAYDSEGNGSLATVPVGYVGSHPASHFPAQKVVRVVGYPAHFLYDGTRLRPINSNANSTCLLYRGGQPSPAVVPSFWAWALPESGASVECTLPDGTRFNEGGAQEYVAWFGASLPLSAADRAAFDVAGLYRAATMAAGFVAAHPASGFPAGRVVRPVGTGTSYVYDGVTLHPIASPAILNCLLKAGSQSTAATVPVMWSGVLPVGDAAACSEPTPEPTPTPLPAPAPAPSAAASERVTVTLAFFFKAGAKRTTFSSLNVEGVPPGASIKAVCRPKCARASLVVRKGSGRVSLRKLIAKARLKVGTVITVTVTKPGAIGAVKTLRVRANARPSLKTACLVPGATKPAAC
ncbi:hypothetical protein OM076_41420 [Solirubrobacter ginsenosidimutans]|uniref:PASTA domain-containing protein n=1 Tax=Solirubrobacter ginsenosidimutans TaxID=490573 RepID=A0A9X3N1N4_9ACTN|nr:hypothetical protein [Solirubrobacter ginsenosidimutans]MDA0166794.1 hypothetical protein [Solirubrobacter ginsenosidimutans]